MHGPTPKNVKSSKSRLQTINPIEATPRSGYSMSKTQSHFLVPSDKLDKVTRRVIAPYAQIERKGVREEEEKPDIYLDINRFNVFLEDTVDLDKLLYETAMVLKTVTESSGVFVYIVDKARNEIVLMQPETKNPERHEINLLIEEGKTAAAHVAFTKQYLVLDDVQRDRRFADGLRWVDAKVALCMPVVKPDGDCYAVLELYRTYAKNYDDTVLYTAVSVVCWAGAAVHQAKARVALQKTSHLNSELRALLQNYFCDLASIDTMLTDMLAVIKTFVGAMRSSFYIIDRENINDEILADMWDDGWAGDKNTVMPRKKAKVNLTQEQTPAGLVARTGVSLNVIDAYKDSRFTNEIDPTTGTVVRSCLVSPILDKTGVIGVVQLTNKINARPFNTEDEQIYTVFVSYCSLIVHFFNMERKKIYHYNLNRVYSELLCLHLKPCHHDLDELMTTNGIIVPPANFKNFNFHLSDMNKEDMAGLVCYMFTETFGEHEIERVILSDFVLTVLQCYRDNAYHNAEHAFSFTHTLYMILIENPCFFDPIETIALMLAGLCHDLDHPGYNNNFLALCKHPLSKMYRSSMLEYHHFFLAKKIIEMKAKALVKDEVVLLLDLIAKHTVITAKSTNATYNKLKDQAWKLVAREFTALTGEVRRPEQLRLKWDNLKKSARKRSIQISQNKLNAVDGTVHIPHDEILDRVAIILESASSGQTVEKGADGNDDTDLQDTSETVDEVLHFHSILDISEDHSNSADVLAGDGVGVEASRGNEMNFTPQQKFFHSTKSGSSKRRKLSVELLKAQRDKDMAMAAYFRVKTEKIKLENIKLELEIKLLKQKNNEVT